MIFEATPPGDNLSALRNALARKGSLRPLQRAVSSMHPAEIAALLESLPAARRDIVWGLVPPEMEGGVLSELSESARAELLRDMDADELVVAVEGMELDDLADLIGDLPETVTQQILRSMDFRDRERLKSVLVYAPDSAGGLMNLDTVSIRADVTMEVVLRYLRMRGELPEHTDRLFVVTVDDRYLGALDITRLLTDDPDRTVAESMDVSVAGIPVDMPASEVAGLFEKRDLLSAAAVSHEGKLLGRITVDDVVDVIREQSDHSIKSLANLGDEEDLFSPTLSSARRRAVWIGANLFNVFIASSVVAIFASAIDRFVALAVLMPIVASMGGIAGTQTVTLIVRGMALGRVGWSNARWLLLKETSVAGLNGMLLAVVVGGYALWRYQHWTLALIMGAALLINLLAAAVVGVCVPLILKTLRIDPALASGVLLTTFTDSIGFVALLGLGARLL